MTLPLTPSPVEGEKTALLICDLRPEWNWRPYVTFWRPNNANYAYPLVWAGDYTEAEVIAGGDYYTTIEDGQLIRFPVERRIVEAMATAPEPGHIDNDTGPVVRQTPENCEALRSAAFIHARAEGRAARKDGA